MKSKTKNIMLTVVIMAVLIAGVFFYFKFSSEQATVGGCSLADSGKVSKTYTCSGDADDRCSVYGSGICTAQTDAKVIARTNKANAAEISPGWVAADINNDGSLESYSYTNYQSQYTSNCQVGKLLSNTALSGGYVYIVSDGIVISNRVCGGYNNYVWYYYKTINPSGVTSTFPTAGYETKELYNKNVYNCSAVLKNGDSVILGRASYLGDVWGSALSVTSKPDINSGVTVTFTDINPQGNPSNYIINYENYRCGSCGECQIGDTKCVDDISYYDCIDNGQGCGIKQIKQAPVNSICKNDIVSACSDGNVCTADTRPAGAPSCIFTSIDNCCKASSECNDNNACTFDTCGTASPNTNRCVFTPNPTCCVPSCNSATQDCVNQVCVNKVGCKYNNPACNFPQTCDLTPPNGLCKCPTGGDWCTPAQLGTERCVNKLVQKCEASGLCNEFKSKATACCNSNTDCDDGNACTADSCSNNRCSNVQIPTCCAPACNSYTQDCVNQVCVNKVGCKYSNPSCSSPQTCDNTLGSGGTCVCPTGDAWCPDNLVFSQKCMDNKIFTCTDQGLCNQWQLSTTCGEEEICV